MTRDDIIRMAKDADVWVVEQEPYQTQLERFAALVAAAEREACAKLCRSEADRALFNFQNDLPQNEPFWNGAEQMASSCENLIKTRLSA